VSDDRDAFWRLGYLPLGQVAEPRSMALLCQEFERIAGPERPLLPADHLIRSQTGSHVRVGLHLCHVNETFRQFALHPGIAARMRAIFGCDVLVLTSLLFNKPAGGREQLDLHQDLPYYPYLEESDLITCWTALDAVGPSSGPVRYLPGTHRLRMQHRETRAQQALDIDPALVDISAAVPVTLSMGEAVVHHGLTVHYSLANDSGRNRRGLATLFIPASTQVAKSDFPYPPLTPLGRYPG
jgi:ectoine hydroxylase-related dioxygenase (phytanoyl-CoA dioxygenase family)